AKGPYSLTVNGNVTLAGGYLTSTLGSVSIAGNVNVSSASSYIAFGSGTWTISGNWTNASTSASWSAGSAVVTFNATTDQIMTFAGANLAGNEFGKIEVDSGSSTVVVNISGGSINVTQTLHDIVVSPGISTTFASSITWSGALTLTNSTSIFDGNLTSSGPAVLNLGTSTLSIAGSWDTSSAATLASIDCAVTFTGGSGTITLGAGQRFGTLTIAGTVALGSGRTADPLSGSPSTVLTITSP